jgi:N-acetylneuraminic acid mutarotase
MTFEYDPSSDIWTTRAPIPAPAGYFGFGWVDATNGKLYAIGGSSSANTGLATLLIYDPSTDTWSIGASMPTGVYLPSVAATSDGKIYRVGGPPCQCNGIPLPTVLVYDPVANAWASQTNLPWGEQAPSVLVLNGYQLYVVGGFYGSG